MLVLIASFLMIFGLGDSFAALPESRDKTTCSRKDIVRQDCALQVGRDRLRLLAETLVWSNGTWHTVDQMPLKGDGTQWEKMQFQSFNGWPLLQVWIWGKGSGETQVQSLHWYVVDWIERKAHVRGEGVVRKRRMKQKAAVDGGKGPVAPSPEYIYDGWETHGLKLQKNGAVEFSLGREKKILERTGHGI